MVGGGSCGGVIVLENFETVDMLGDGEQLSMLLFLCV